MTDVIPFVWPVTVYYEDTDAGGVVYHANYLKFFERARTEMLRSIGVNQHTFLKDHIGFVVRHMDLDFLKGARLDEHLKVKTWVISASKVTLVFEQQLVRPDESIVCKATVKIACVNLSTMRPTAIPNDIIMEIVP
jgi:acyl-CoA thioester hydrolase